MITTQQWGAYMAFTGAAPSTVTTRTRALRRLARSTGGVLAALTPVDLVSYLSKYEHASTRATILSYIRCYYAWALEQGIVDADPTARIPKVKVPKYSPRPAARDDVAALLRTATPRTRSFALLMAYAGLRCCEVARFRREHLYESEDRWFVDIPLAKGGHHQSVPIAGWVADELRAGPTWTVGVQTVQKDVRDALRAVGSPSTPHQLRHYYGTTALQTTQNLRKVQDMMRHASPATTARYTQVTPSELSDAAEGLPRIA